MVGDEDESRRDALHRQADRGRQRHRAGHQAGGYHHLQRARTARERHSHRIARPGSGHQVPHRRRAALRHAADREGLALHHHFAHQGHERAGYRRAPRPAGRPFPRALQGPPDRFPRLHHADDPRRRRRAPRARQGVDEREVRQALARRGGILRTTTWSKFRRYIKEPYGMVLVTGPTGSGKTTTLYAR